ncbi:hypothetical protein GRF59_06905 [Paenibacillus sp. HJL G12]|uniref:SLH domain-containing protein n=1 Tax=Paenibacillus dendrobii TaxID=2691084 RepID=A0A7X3IG75_9BACL|nr:hypothetical protein [Paenibacillus dendrobii]
MEEVSSRNHAADLSVFADRDQIGSWASEAIKAAIGANFMEGYGNKLRPQQPLTRAETAVLIHRMLIITGLIDGAM